MIKAIDIVLPIRGMSEEIEGVADNETVTDKTKGTAPNAMPVCDQVPYFCKN